MENLRKIRVELIIEKIYIPKNINLVVRKTMSSGEEDADDWKSSICEDDCEDVEVDKFETKDEIDVFDRVGFSGLTGNAPKTRLEKAAQEPLEKFIQSVEAIALYIRNRNDTIVITNSDIEKMVETASYLEHVEHKNPSAYILGFLATEKGKIPPQLRVENYNEIIKKVLPLIDSDASVFPEDVIRYSRLWLKLYSKKSRV